MDERQLPKLEIERFETVGRGQTPIAQKPQQTNSSNRPVQRSVRWKSAAEKVRQTVRSARDAVRMDEGGDKKSDDSNYRRLLIKTGICAVIAIVILGLSSINTPGTDNTVQTMDSAVSHQFDIEEDIGRLKFVQNLDDDAQSVFSPMPASVVVFPAEGEVLTSFGEGGSKGVRIVPDQTDAVCIAKGTVTTVGQIGDMGFVKVVLDSGETVVYHNVRPAVMTDDIVQPGQPVGEVIGEYLYIEMKDGEVYIDPLAYIQSGGADVQ